MKKELRQVAKEITSGLTDTATKDRKILSGIYNLSSFASADEVFVYSGVFGEPNLGDLYDVVLNLKKKLAFPLCMENGEMEFYFISDLNDLSIGKYGIPEPRSKEFPSYLDSTINRIIICPGLAFDKNLNRLGRGKAYYDKFLQKNRNAFSQIIGVCYKELLFDCIPTNELDQKMDVIITD